MVRDSAEVQASDPVALLAQHDIDAAVVAGDEQVDWISTHHPPQLVLLDASPMDERALDRCAQRLRRLTLPAIALIPISELGAVDRLPAIDDFVALPSNPIELVARATRPDQDPAGREFGRNPSRRPADQPGGLRGLSQGHTIEPALQGVRATPAAGVQPRQGVHA